jgi:hypothetical protein
VPQEHEERSVPRSAVRRSQDAVIQPAMPEANPKAVWLPGREAQSNGWVGGSRVAEEAPVHPRIERPESSDRLSECLGARIRGDVASGRSSGLKGERRYIHPVRAEKSSLRDSGDRRDAIHGSLRRGFRPPLGDERLTPPLDEVTIRGAELFFRVLRAVARTFRVRGYEVGEVWIHFQGKSPPGMVTALFIIADSRSFTQHDSSTWRVAGSGMVPVFHDVPFAGPGPHQQGLGVAALHRLTSCRFGLNFRL